MGKRIVRTAARVAMGPCLALFFFVACSGGTNAPGGPGTGGTTGDAAGGGRSDSGTGGSSSSGSGGTSSGSGSGSSSGASSGGGTSGGSGSSGGADASTSSSSSSSGSSGSGSGSSSGGGSSSGDDASTAFDAIGSADVVWGEACLYNFGSACPFPPGQECGNHQAIDVTFPNGPQLLNATLFAGVDCSPTALQDNFNDQQTTRGSDLWMFTDDADVPGTSAGNPTSAIWWVGPLTADGFPPAGAPTTGCINYTAAMAMCQ